MHTFNASMDSPPTPPHTLPHQKTTSLHKGEKAAWEWITEWFCSKYGTLCTAWILEIKPESPSFGKNCTAERFISLAKWEMIHMLEFHHLDVMKSLPPCLPQAPTSRFWETLLLHHHVHSAHWRCELVPLLLLSLQHFCQSRDQSQAGAKSAALRHVVPILNRTSP